MSQPNVLAEPRIATKDIPREHAFERNGLKLVTIGKILQSLEGCACPMGVLSREFLKKLGKCTHCGVCADVCAHNALAVLKDRVMTFHELCHGCGACSYLCPEHAITERPRDVGVLEIGSSDGIDFVQGKLNVGEAMAPPIIRQVKKYVNGQGVSIVDASPGTSCPVVEAIKGRDFCLLVTDPTPFGLNGLILAVEVVRILGIPCGVVINRSGQTDGEAEEYCRQQNVPILMKVPLHAEIARLYSRGVTLAEGKPEWPERFRELFDRIEREARDGRVS